MYGRTWNRIELLHRFVCVVALVAILAGAASVAVLFIIQSQTSTSEFASLLLLHLCKRPRRYTCCGCCHYVGQVCMPVFVLHFAWYCGSGPSLQRGGRGVARQRSLAGAIALAALGAAAAKITALRLAGPSYTARRVACLAACRARSAYRTHSLWRWRFGIICLWFCSRSDAALTGANVRRLYNPVDAPPWRHAHMVPYCLSARCSYCRSTCAVWSLTRLGLRSLASA